MALTESTAKSRSQKLSAKHTRKSMVARVSMGLPLFSKREKPTTSTFRDSSSSPSSTKGEVSVGSGATTASCGTSGSP